MTRRRLASSGRTTEKQITFAVSFVSLATEDTVKTKLNGTQAFVAADNEGAAKSVANIAEVVSSHTAPLWAGLTSMRAVNASRDVIRFISIDSAIEVANIGIKTSHTVSLVVVGQRIHHSVDNFVPVIIWDIVPLLFRWTSYGKILFGHLWLKSKSTKALPHPAKD